MLFTFYLVIAAYLITHNNFIKRTGLVPKLILSLFLLKVVAGILVGWIFQKYYPGNDYWAFNKDGLIEYDLLINQPGEFFTSIFRSPYQNGYEGFFNSVGSYWNDLRYNIIIKLLAFCNLFSRGNYYINSLFFNFFGFFGSVGLFHVFSAIYKNRKWAIIIGCFLLPSTLFYSSGIHKDLIVFTMLGLFCYALYFSATQNFNVRRVIILTFTFITILLIRNYVAVALIPFSLGFIICIRKKINPFISYLTVFAGICILTITWQLLRPSFQPLKIITQKQSDFLDLPTAGSQLSSNILEPNIKSFALNLPQAIEHGFLRPYLWDQTGSFGLLLSIELLAYEIIFFLIIIKFRSTLNFRHPFILFSLFFAFSMLLITGYIIPNIAAISRYKSIYLPFLITPFLCALPWKFKST